MNQAINAAIETARAKAAGNAKWTRSVEKAAAALLSGELIVTVLADNGGLVTSPRGCYHIRHGFCDCPATVNHCYHVSALRIVALADELETAPAPVRRPTITRSVEYTHTGARVLAVRCDNWLV